MGQTYNKDMVLLDWMPNRIGYSKEHKLSDWDFEDRPKNWEYWSGNRNFIISRSFYTRDWENGFLYGRYPILNPIDIIDETLEAEDDEWEI